MCMHMCMCMCAHAYLYECVHVRAHAGTLYAYVNMKGIRIYKYGVCKEYLV